MSHNVVQFPGPTSCDLPPERVLHWASEAGLTEVVVIGRTKDGEEYIASSSGDCRNVLWLLERAKLELFDVTSEERNQR